MRIENKFPIFTKGNILKKEDLDLLRDNPIGVLGLNHMDKKDGIIKGFDVKINEEEKKIIVSKGLAKCKDKILWNNKESILEIPEEEDRYIIKIKMENEVENRRYYVNVMEIVVEKGTDLGENEIEIGRFISRIGAELRNDYMNFKDLRRDYNLIEIINTKYSAKNKRGTIHPKVLELFVRDGMTKDRVEEIDNIFFMNCLNGNIERESIIFYVNRKLDLKKESYTNEELYYKLLEILEKLGNEKSNFERKKIVPKKITVD